MADKIPSSASCNRNWHWQYISGSPTWLWGGDDPGTDIYVYNPNELKVGYAAVAGRADNLMVENVTVTISAGTNFSYVGYKPGYILASAVGTTFTGVYVNGIANTGSNYAVFYNTPVDQDSSLTLNLTWIKI